MQIAVAGTGYVGLVAGVCLAEKGGHLVTCVDNVKDKIEQLSLANSTIYEAGLPELLKKNLDNGKIRFTTDFVTAYKDADVVFICVGTPEMPDGSANLQYVLEVAKQIGDSITSDTLVIVKSTVPVGTSDKVEKVLLSVLKQRQISSIHVEVASNPEFLAQGNAVSDMINANRIVIGVETPEAEAKLREVYVGFDSPIVAMNRHSAELTKYACNCFLALKLGYMNELANLCQLMGANVTQVAEAMSYDPRIGSKFLNAGCGYGGSCFPKDTKALVNFAKKTGAPITTVEAAIEVNAKQKLFLLEKAKRMFANLAEMKVAILGCTFKPGTDDLRESPALANIDELLSLGVANIVCYDPVGLSNLKKKYSSLIEYANSCEEALNKADIAFVFTEWKEITKITPTTFANLMAQPIVFDGRNIYSQKEMEQAGIEYYSIGR